MPHTLSSEMLTAWLRLSMTPGLGPITCQRLLSHFADPLEIERCPPHRLATLVPKALCEALLLVRSASFTHEIKLALTWAQSDDQFILTRDHDAYPPQLKQTADAPIVLFAKGSLARLKQPALAIVGARQATADGLDHARDFACALAQQGWCVVSGLALGVDAAAHQGAIQAGASGGGTIAVLGTGADVVYPRNHAELTKRILDTEGLIVSEFSLGTPARPHHFPRRNRIVAGLCHGVLVVEAALKSGSLLTAKLALDMNRDVFAIPGSIDSPLSRGPHALIQEGAKLVESATDILSELASFCVPQTVSIPTATASLSKAAPLSPVWDAIGYDPVSEDILQQRTNMLPAILQCELLMLELNGHIERRPNGRVVRARKRPSTSN